MELLLGDCLERMKELPDNSVDSIVTDPPYGLSEHKPADTVACLQAWIAGEEYKPKKRGFMGHTWDSWVPGPEVWKECFRVLKPGGHIACFAGSRTHDLMSIAIRLAGFENRDTVMWVYGSGFPKSLDVSKAIDKLHGAEREVIGSKDVGPDMRGGNFKSSEGRMVSDITAPTTDDAKQWAGWGTSLKPAHEPILLFRKLLIGTVAENVLAHGTGGINIDASRIPTDDNLNGGAYSNGDKDLSAATSYATGVNAGVFVQPLGRWPANLIHDGSEEVLDAFPDAKGQQGNVKGTEESRTGGEGTNCYGEYGRVPSVKREETETSAARFYYCPKTSKSDRNSGLEFDPVWLDSIELIWQNGSESSISEVYLWENQGQNQNTDCHGGVLPLKGMLGGMMPAHGGSDLSTLLSGSDITGLYLKGIRFTTSTRSKRIIGLKTLNLLTDLTINENMEGVKKIQLDTGLSPAENAGLLSLLTQITTKGGMVYPLGVSSAAKKMPQLINAKDAVTLSNKGNFHSTVKPTALMSYVCKLITPVGGTV